MISAEEARGITRGMCKEAERQLEDIEYEIRRAASMGERSFWHDGYVHKQTRTLSKAKRAAAEALEHARYGQT